MIPYVNRFHGRGSIRYVYTNGQIVRGKLCNIRYLSNKRRTRPRIAVVISKKVLKGAVGRNQIRRRMYEYLRSQLTFLKPDSDIVVIIGSAEIRNLSAKNLQTLLSDQLVQADLYKPD